MQHTTALKRVLRYLSGTRTYGITYSSNPQYPALLGYVDAAYANADDLKSTSGYVFLVGRGAITWRSKKQTTIALSSTEAEYVALSEAAREACWLQSLYDELGFSLASPILIRGNNDGSIALAKNPMFHKRSKHIAIRWHWVRDLVQDGIMCIESCHDHNQTVDVLTKALPCPKHKQHTQNGTRIGLRGSVGVRPGKHNMSTTSARANTNTVLQHALYYISALSRHLTTHQRTVQ
jgi:hypothetical protein